VGSSGWASERGDLGKLLTAAVVVPATWWVFLGWRPRLCVSGYDGLSAVLPMLQRLVEAGGEWATLAYRADLLGGAAVRDTLGPMPLVSLLAGAGLTATAVFNVATFTTQALLAFFALRAAQDLAVAWGERAVFGWAWRVVGVWLAAFAPVLGWRIGYGHLSLLVGLLPFAAALSLGVAAA
jgi:hypothetical protein